SGKSFIMYLTKFTGAPLPERRLILARAPLKPEEKRGTLTHGRLSLFRRPAAARSAVLPHPCLCRPAFRQYRDLGGERPGLALYRACVGGIGGHQAARGRPGRGPAPRPGGGLRRYSAACSCARTRASVIR